LAAKSLEIGRLSDALSISPKDEAARGALAEHLADLRDSARELGFVDLEGAVAEALTRLEHESFEPSSLVAVRVLAQWYESLAAMPSQSGTHRAVAFPALVRMGSGRFVVAERFVPAEPPRGSGPGRELIASEIQQDSWPVADPVERENVRAQLAVSMHREPANPVPDWGYPIWRLQVGTGAAGRESSSGFGMEMRTTPRLLGLAFATLLSATVAFLIWRQVTPGGAPTTAPAPVQTVAKDPHIIPDAPAATPMVPGGGPPAFAAFSGSLRAGIDPSLEVAEGQGVLELIGPAGVSIEIDGVDRGALPLTLALDHGRHAVRYSVGARSTYRFYYVKSGTTRALRVLTQAGGLVDAR